MKNRSNSQPGNFKTDPQRTYDEKNSLLILDPELPVAVSNLNALGSLGLYEKISSYDAYRLRTITNDSIRKWFSVDDHIWVNPSERYGKAWEAAGLKKTPNSHFDHLHSKAAAIAQGYKYVLLYCCQPGANTGAGSEEAEMKRTADPTQASKQPILFATELHWRKLWLLTKSQMESG